MIKEVKLHIVADAANESHAARGLCNVQNDLLEVELDRLRKLGARIIVRSKYAPTKFDLLGRPRLEADHTAIVEIDVGGHDAQDHP